MSDKETMRDLQERVEELEDFTNKLLGLIQRIVGILEKEGKEDQRDAEIARLRLDEMRDSPGKVLRGAALEKRMKRLVL